MPSWSNGLAEVASFGGVLPAMSVPAPHFLLAPQAAVRSAAGGNSAGQWRFVLTTAEGQTCLEAEDDEPESSPERLELLAIVRGLEALDEPAQGHTRFGPPFDQPRCALWPGPVARE